MRTTAIGPECVKTLSEFGSIGAAVCQFGLELPECLGEVENGGHKRPFSGPHDVDQRPVTQYLHHAFQIVGKDMERHFRTDPIKRFCQEVRAAHP
jgi:hypothetical protein